MQYRDKSGDVDLGVICAGAFAVGKLDSVVPSLDLATNPVDTVLILR